MNQYRAVLNCMCGKRSGLADAPIYISVPWSPGDLVPP